MYSPETRVLSIALPKLDGLVVLERGGRDDVLGGVARRAQHRVRVARQPLHDLLRLQVPDVHQVVLRARHDPLLAGRDELGEVLVE